MGCVVKTCSDGALNVRNMRVRVYRLLKMHMHVSVGMLESHALLNSERLNLWVRSNGVII